MIDLLGNIWEFFKGAYELIKWLVNGAIEGVKAVIWFFSHLGMISKIAVGYQYVLPGIFCTFISGALIAGVWLSLKFKK